MEWPIWSQTTEEQKPMWNAELVAKLEAERATGLPRRTPGTATEPASEVVKRRHILTQIATKRTQSGPNPND